VTRLAGETEHDLAVDEVFRATEGEEAKFHLESVIWESGI
jgi:hypothetical protein